MPADLGEGAWGEDSCGAAESVGGGGSIAVSFCFVLAGEGGVFGVFKR